MIGWILCVITRIREDISNNLNISHMIQVDTVIKTLFTGLSDKYLYKTLDTFWSEYKKIIMRMIHLTVMNLSGVVLIFVMEIVICGIPSTKVLVVVACRVT